MIEPVSPRQSDIIALAKRDGRVAVDLLAAQFEVTPQTIRKDLNELCERRLLQRVHGGAVYPSSVTNFAYDSRRMLAAEEKRRIGLSTAALIPDNTSLILNIGTTTEQVAAALRRHRGIMVITNNLNAAHILREAPAVEVVIAGGVVRRSDGGVVGEATVDFVRQFRVDYAVVGVSAIDEAGELLDYDYREVRVAQEIIRHARETILVADSMKFERRAPVRIAHLSEVDIFVTDRPPPAGLAAICAESNVRLVIADSDQARAGGGDEDGDGDEDGAGGGRASDPLQDATGPA
ncbi:MAG: DeoR/GlpR family DNA-binding transcription regulator [Sneathiellaceae bacterium]